MLEMLLGLGKKRVGGEWENLGTGNGAVAALRSGTVLAKKDRKLYRVGGFSSSTGTRSAELHEYDIDSKTWVRLADMPDALRSSGGCFIGEFLYVFGGQNASGAVNSFYRYNLSNNTWETLTTGPGKRFFFALGSIGTKLYLHGGTSVGAIKLSDFWEYDTVSGTWTQLASGPSARRYHSGAVLNGKFYLFGGETSASGSIGDNELWEYDPETASWTLYPTNIPPRSHPLLMVVPPNLYVYSGRSYIDGAWVNFNDFWQNQTFETWETRDNEPGYLGGSYGAGSQVSDDDEIYLYNYSTGVIWKYS